MSSGSLVPLHSPPIGKRGGGASAFRDLIQLTMSFSWVETSWWMPMAASGARITVGRRPIGREFASSSSGSRRPNEPSASVGVNEDAVHLGPNSHRATVKPDTHIGGVSWAMNVIRRRIGHGRSGRRWRVPTPDRIGDLCALRGCDSKGGARGDRASDHWGAPLRRRWTTGRINLFRIVARPGGFSGYPRPRPRTRTRMRRCSHVYA